MHIMRSFVLGWNVSCFQEILHKSTLLPLSAPLCLYILTNHISLGRGRCVLWCVKWLDGLKRFRSVCRTIPHIINAALRTPLNSWWSGRQVWANGLFLGVYSTMFPSLLLRGAWSIFHRVLGNKRLMKTPSPKTEHKFDKPQMFRIQSN